MVTIRQRPARDAAAHYNAVDGMNFTQEAIDGGFRVFLNGIRVCDLFHSEEAQTVTMVELDGTVTERKTKARGRWLSHWEKMRREAIRRFMAA